MFLHSFNRLVLSIYKSIALTTTMQESRCACILLSLCLPLIVFATQHHSPRVAILLLATDKNYPHEQLFNEKALERAKECWTGNCTDIHDDVVARWHLGNVVWEEILGTQKSMQNYFDVYFVKYDVTQESGYVNVQKHNHTSTIVVGNQPAEWYKSNDTVNSLTYKSLMAMNYLLQSPHRYSYYVRGNANILIDLCNFHRYLRIAPMSKLYTSPFWQGTFYAYGYFILMSADVARWSIDQFKLGVLQKVQREQALKYKRGISHGADDCDLEILAIGKLGDTYVAEPYAYPSKHNVMTGGDPPGRDNKQRYSLKNKYGIRLDNDNGDHGGSWNYAEAKKFLSTRDNNTFLYRVKDTSDHHYIDLIRIIVSSFKERCRSHQ